MSLKTDKRFTARHWTVMPVTQMVIDRVHALAHSNQNETTMKFYDHDKSIIEDDDIGNVAGVGPASITRADTDVQEQEQL